MSSLVDVAIVSGPEKIRVQEADKSVLKLKSGETVKQKLTS